MIEVYAKLRPLPMSSTLPARYLNVLPFGRFRKNSSVLLHMYYMLLLIENRCSTLIFNV
jgi:hypothetical protein